MPIRSQADMLEATRLTRAGKLHEALDMLRGVVSGTRRPEDGGESHRAHRAAPHRPDVLDMVAPSPETGGAWTASPPPDGSAAVPPRDTAEPPYRTRPFFRRLRGLRPLGGLEGLVRPPATRPAPPPLPDGATFTDYSFASELGSRTYKLFVPGGYGDSPVPLVLMLHGCKQSPDDFAAGTRMNELGQKRTFLVAYPAQPQSANPSRCWNWFNGGDQLRDQGEPALIAGITRRVMRDFAVDPRRVYVAGLSAGGAAAAIMGARYPDLYAGVGIHSGLACGAAHDVPSAFAAMRHGGGPVRGPAAHSRRNIVPTIVFHGDADATVNPVNGDQIIAGSGATANLRSTVSRGSANGLNYTCTVQTDESGRSLLEQWVIHGAGHAWSGGSDAGSFTQTLGPDASREMIRFFLQHSAGA